MIKLYTNHCPACGNLKELLDAKKIQYEEVDDVQYMLSIGLSHMPMLELEDGTRLKYAQALKWVNEKR